MKAFLALLRREWLEHRIAFLYIPAVATAFLLVAMIGTVTSGKVNTLAQGFFPAIPGPIYAAAYLGVAALWGGYLALMTFFYFADAFNADSRNNAMLFWKSMPQSDLKILLTKLAAGLVMFPLVAFCWLLLSGLVLYGAILGLQVYEHIFATSTALTIATNAVNLSGALLAYLVLAIIWYAPALAWVGLLSTIVGRWSIPLAIAIPVALGILENTVDFGQAPLGGYLLHFLQQRMTINFDTAPFIRSPLELAAINASRITGELIAGVDWVEAAAGVAFAFLCIYLASQYRRRVTKR
jgi:ABC-2 type transport system permease protein